MIAQVMLASALMCTPTPQQAVTSAAYLHGWSGDQLQCLNEIVRLESRWNVKADNKDSTAYGLFQMLNEKSHSPITQAMHGTAYIEHRFKTPCRALVTHSRKGWY